MEWERLGDEAKVIKMGVIVLKNWSSELLSVVASTL